MIKRIAILGSVAVLIVIALFIISKYPPEKDETSAPLEVTSDMPTGKEAKEIAQTRQELLNIAETSQKENPELKQCIEKARNLYRQNKLPESQKQFKACLIIDPKSINAQISLASILFLRKDYARAKKEFTTSLTLLPKKSDLTAYVYSMLGDIAIIENNITDAEKYYSIALEIKPVTVNAQVGLARIYELTLEWDKAATGYKRALIWDPCNIKANEGLRRVRPYVMADSEILTNLKERKTPLVNEVELAPVDKKLFYKICQSEQMGAIDYIKTKLRTLHPAYIMEKKPNQCPLELYLTHKGFEVYRKLISKDAIELFRKRDISLKYIFMLRDKKGRRVFDPKLGLLTYDGFNVYYQMLEGKTPYILSSEAIDVTGKTDEALLTMPVDERQITQLQKQGFELISKAEYIWIKEATNCSETTLEKDLDLKIIRTPKKISYMIDTLGIRRDLGTFKTLVERYRQGDFSTDVSPQTHRTFFGTGPESKTLRLCKEDGTLNI